MDPLRIVAPGDAYEPSAARENAWTEAARWVRERQLNSNRTPMAGLAGGTVLVKNQSGADREQFEILAVDDHLVTPGDNLKEFQRRIGLAGKTPAAQHAGQFVVLAQPIKADSIGPAFASGAVAVKIKMVSESHPYADVLPGDCTQLQSADSGAARILSVESGTGTKWGYVRIGAGGGGGSSYPACNVICSEPIPANSLARILSYNRHSDTYLVAKPEANDLPLSQLVWIPDAIEANTPGTGMLDFGAAELLTDDTIKPGDTIGSRAGSWKARKGLLGLEVAAVVSGTMARVHILTPCSNYVSPPTLTFAGGSATRQATALCKIDAGKLSQVIMLDSGADYLSAPTPTISGNATVEAVLVSAIDELTLGDKGSGYAANSSYALTFTATNGGSGAAGYADSDADGYIYRLRLTARGLNYLAAPTVTIPNPPGYPAAGKAVATGAATVA